jgi:hypothetical protein
MTGNKAFPKDLLDGNIEIFLSPMKKFGTIRVLGVHISLSPIKNTIETSYIIISLHHKVTSLARTKNGWQDCRHAINIPYSHVSGLACQPVEMISKVNMCSSVYLHMQFNLN